MWVPGSLAFLVPAAAFAWRLLAPASPRTAPPSEARGPGRGRRPAFDLLRAPLVGPLLQSRYGRRGLQAACFVLAGVVVIDGFVGPPAGAANLATGLAWTWGRALAVIGLLAAGNFFCMACPFTLPRALARRVRLPISMRAFPAALRSKWLAAGLLVVFFWAYEAFDLWNRPAATAALVLVYF